MRSFIDSSRRAIALSAAGFVAAGSLVCVTAATPTSAVAAPSSGATNALTGATFADPPTSVRPKYRWWVPLAYTEDEQLRAELADMKATGAGGAEVVGFSASGAGATSKEFLTEYGWGTPAWSNRLKTMLDAATELDLGLDLTIGPRWPALVPTVSDINDPRASQQLTSSYTYVKGGRNYAGNLTTGLTPTPVASANKTLVAALLARCTNADCQTQPNYTRLLERDSVIDVTSQVAVDNTLSYPIPGDASQTWVVLGFYQTGEDHKRTNLTATTPNYYLDHISAQGLAATTDFYETAILPTIGESVTANGRVDLYEDSLELGDGQKWTWDFVEQWEERRGYSPIEVLPALVGAGTQVVTERPSFDFSDGSGSRVRTDYRQTWSDLYINVRLKPLKAWANEHGMNLRVQPYGMPVDTPEAASVVDVPEGESLAFNNNIEDYKLQAVGAHLNGTAVVSNECCAIRDTVWDTRAGGSEEPGNLFGAFRSFAGGVTQIVWHGYPYLTQGDQTNTAAGTVWPGMTYSNNISFAEAFGAKGSPSWQDYKAVNDQLGRLQLVLRQGQPQVDVAVYWQDFGMSGHGTTGYGDKTMLPSTSDLAAAGYTYEYLSPANLARDDAKVTGGRLFPDTAGYRALVIFDQETMAVESAERIIALAEDGLPVIVVGALPTATPGLNEATRSDAELARLMAALEEKVTRVDSLDDLPDSLKGVKVTPDAAHATESSAVVSVHRKTADTDYYYLFNQEQAAAQQTLTLRGEGRPYLLDSWTGEIAPLTNYREVAGGITVDVSMAAATTKVIALTTRTGDGFEAGPTGAKGAPEDAAIADVVSLNDWKLSVQGWSHGSTGAPGDTAMTDLGAVDLVADENGSLPAWKDITPANGYSLDLTDVSGIGTYSTTVTLPDSWRGVKQAWIDLGSVVDTAVVSVNGAAVPVDPQDPQHVEIGKHLVAGENAISVRVASTLLNAVRVAPNTGASGRERASYGLFGAVRLIPHKADQPLLGVELLDKALPLGQGGTNQARVSISNFSADPVTVTLTPTTSDPAVQATLDSPTIDLAAQQTVTSIVRVRGDKDAGTTTVSVAISADTGASGAVKLRLEHSRNLALNTLGTPYPQTIASSAQDRYVPEFTTDGDPATFWVSGGQFPGQAPTPSKPEYLGVDLGEPTVLKAISLWGKTNYGPRNYDVQTSMDAKSWKTVASVTEAPKYGKTTSFAPERARYVRALITTGYYTASPGSNTQVLEFSVFGQTSNLALNAVPTASSTNSKFNVWAVNDGSIHGYSDYAIWNAGNGWNDGTKSAYPDLVTLTWPEPVTLSTARVFSVDNGTNPAATYSLRDYTVQALVDGSWRNVATVTGNTAGMVDSAFAPVTTTALRVSIAAVNGVGDYSRMVEFEAYCLDDTCPALDKAAPTVAVSTLGSASGDWVAADGKIVLTATDEGSGVVSVEYRIDGGAWQDYTTAFGLEAGLHRVDVRATDLAGNRSPTQSLLRGMDETAPVTTASAARVDGDPATIEVTLTAEDAESGPGTTWYSIDGATAEKYAAAFRVGDPATHVITYWSDDAVGNAEEPRTLATDRAALDDLVTQADDLSEADFTSSTWQDIAAPLAAARAVLADVNAVQSEVDAALSTLSAAMAGLVVRGDPEVLGALIELSEALTGKLDGFTDASAAALRTSLESAKATYADRADKTQPELDAAVSGLRSAVDGLKLKEPAIDKSVLKAVIDAAVGVSNKDNTYTAASWSTLQEQIANAQAVLDAPSSSQSAINAAAKALTSALAGLEVVKLPPVVVAPTVAKVKLNQTQLRLVKGKTFTLADGVYYTGGAASSYSGRVRWTSSNPKVISVSGDGRLRARKSGSATITVRPTQRSASGESLSAKIRVTVVSKKPKSKVAKVSAKPPKWMRTGQIAFITGTYTSTKATGVKVTYKSSSSRVAEIDPVGRILAKKPGKVKITVKAGSRSRTYTITVK